jgi:hypothetical protein
MPEEIAIVLVTFIVIGIPMLGLTARFALKPIVESILRLREAFAETPRGTAPLESNAVQQLEEEVAELRRQIQRLTEATEFDRKLLGSDEN